MRNAAPADHDATLSPAVRRGRQPVRAGHRRRRHAPVISPHAPHPRLRVALAAVSAVGAAGLVGFSSSAPARLVGLLLFVLALAYMAQVLREARR